MTVSSAVNKVAYTANGTSKNFSVPFYFIYKTDLKVYRMIGDVQELLVLDTDYTITGTPEQADGTIYKDGGTVVMDTMPAAGTRFIIMREVPLTQEADYQEGGTFPAILHELALDKLTMAVQQLAEESGRSVKVNMFSDTDPAQFAVEIEVLYGIKDEMVALAAITTAIGSCYTNMAAILDAPTQATAAAGSAATAQEWAAKMDGKIGGVDYSSKYYADLAKKWSTSSTIIEDGKYGASYYALQAYNANVSAQNAKTRAQEWASKTDGAVESGKYSAKYYAELITPIASDISALAAIKDDITDVASIKADVSAVALKVDDVSTAAAGINDIVLCAYYMDDIRAAPTKAGEAAASAAAAAAAQEQVEFIASFEELFGGTFGDDTDNEIFGGNL